MSVASVSKKFGAASKLVIAVVVAGALVGGVMLPFVGGVGLAAKSTTTLLDDTTEFDEGVPDLVTTVQASDGSTLTYLYTERRSPVPLAQIPLVMQQAIIAIEDARFYQHGGLDAQGLSRAVLANARAGSIEEGGSTITQQYVKNVLLYGADTPEEEAAAVDPSLTRKLREANLALQVEQMYSKEEILEKYLNLMNFGGDAYGVAAATRVYFNKNVNQLTLTEAAMLAGLVQSPNNLDPLANDPVAALERRNEVLERMADQDYISAADAATAQAAPLGLSPSPPPPRNCLTAVIGRFFCDWMLQYLSDPAPRGLGLSEDVIYNSGLTIRTTLDPRMQNAGDRAMLEQLAPGDQFAGLFSLVDPTTGKVRALATNKVYGTNVDDPAQTTVKLFTTPSSGSGSTYKVFTALAALEQLKGIDYTLTSDDPYTSRVFRGEGPEGFYGPVGNAGSYARTLNLETALYQSSNTYFVHLEDELGSIRTPVEMAQRLGLWYPENPLPAQIIAEERGSFTLGPEATSPLLLATAYGTIAARGTRCWPTPIEQILDRNNQPLLGADGQPVVKSDNCTANVIDPGLADTVTQILRKDVDCCFSGQTGSRARVEGHDLAGKTGTTQDNKGVFFVGYTPQLVASVGVFNPDTPTSLGDRSFGGGIPATVFGQAMTEILGPMPNMVFPPGSTKYDRGNSFSLSVGCSGDSVSTCDEALRALGLNPVVADGRVDSGVAEGRVAYTSPGSGDRVTDGQTVLIYISNGSQVAPEPTRPTTSSPAPTSRSRPPRGGGGGGGGTGVVPPPVPPGPPSAPPTEN